MKLTFCRSCGRVALRTFSYCPYCGVALRPGPSLEDACSSIDSLDASQAAYRSRLIEELLAELDVIESDVEAMLHEDPSPAG